ncbi:MAG TPA: glycosyltransferase family 2 protein [Thermoplasmata archaeon]|nr:glycosyltransferase family 2 protein [Thermoplasmata archaeon]
MLALWVVLAIVVGSILVLLFQGVAILFAYTMPLLAPAPAGPTSSKRVSVVLAARNEEVDLPATLDGLLAQDYPNLEIVVVDGGSTDGTRAVIDARAPRVRRLDEGILPPGWVGKNWACWTGAQATSGDWLLFVDADVRTHPAAVRTVVGWAESENADLASIAPTVEMVGFWERVVLPFYIQTILTYFRAPRVNRDTSHTALANGQFCLVRRSAYERVGGHDAVRSYILEDVAIARRLRNAGSRLRFAQAPELARTRMYRNRHELFEGLLKNVHGGEFSGTRMVGFFVGLAALFLLPLLVLPFGWWEGSLLLTGLGAFLWIALFGKHVGFARGVGAPAVYGLLYPLAVGFYLVLVSTSLVRGLRKRPVMWKGRSYDLVEPGHANR